MPTPSSKFPNFCFAMIHFSLDSQMLFFFLSSLHYRGQLQGPFMRLIKAMRASEYKTDSDNPFVRFNADLIDTIGEEPHNIPTVFSFFGPSYVSPGKHSDNSCHKCVFESLFCFNPFVTFTHYLYSLSTIQTDRDLSTGRARAANILAPEAEVLNGPSSISTANGLLSLFKYGSSRCGDSFFRTSTETKTSSINVCVIGDNSTNFGNNKYSPSDYDLNPRSADEVVDDLATLLTSGRLSPENRQIIKGAFEETLTSGKTELEALVNAQQLIALSPEFHSNSLVRKTNQPRTVPEQQDATNVQYKAVIHLMLAGGMDSFNVLVPKSCSGTNDEGTKVDVQYLEERGALAFNKAVGDFELTIEPNTEQPCEKFAIHKELPYIKELYNDKDLLFFANTGVVNANGMNRGNWDVLTKSRLFGHEAMEKEIRKVDPFNNLAGSGVLGRLNDLLATKYDSVVNAIGIQFNSIALAGDPATEIPTSIVGRDGPVSFGQQQKDELYFDLQGKAAAINSEQDAFSSVFGETWSEVFSNGVDNNNRLSEYLANENNVKLDEEIWKVVADEDKIYRSFQTLAKMIQTRTDRNADRDTFTIEYGGFDHHSSMKPLLEEKLIAVNRNLKRLIEQLKTDGIWDQVTIVVASEFGRTITPNSNDGADHGWGGNYFIMGGNIKGRRVLGKYPDDLTNDSRLNASRSTRTRFIPTLSWDAIWNGIVEWFTDGFGEGFAIANDDDLDYVLPNRNNCIDPVEGEGNVPLFKKDDLYE